MVNSMLLNNNKFSKKNKRIYQNKCINLRDEEYNFEEDDNFNKVERFNGLPTKRK